MYFYICIFVFIRLIQPLAVRNLKNVLCCCLMFITWNFTVRIFIFIFWMMVKNNNLFVIFPPRPEIQWCFFCRVFVFSIRSSVVKTKEAAAERLGYHSFPFNYIFELWTVCKMPRRSKFCPSCRRSRAKKPSASGDFAPWPPDQGLCPWAALGAPTPDPRYRLVLRTRHGLQPGPLNLKCWLRPRIRHKPCCKFTA